MGLVKQQRQRNLADDFADVRAATVALCANLTPEDCNMQAMPETSPVKWHLAHTTWFFETFVLLPFCTRYRPVHPQYRELFNSYYNGVGAQFARPHRAILSRPAFEEVLHYRDAITAAVLELLDDHRHPDAPQIAATVDLGLHHEAQHQELLLTDIKYSFFQNPLLPAYRDGQSPRHSDIQRFDWVHCAGGEVGIGCVGNGFSFDNEKPRYKVLLAPFLLGNRLISNAEYLEFVEAGGYGSPEVWLADGWTEVCNAQWTQPLYWKQIDGQWFEYTLNGLQLLDSYAPVAHVSYFEAQAYATWAGCRLPTETEWESVAQSVAIDGNFLDSGALHPAGARSGRSIRQLFGDCWEWTNSAYLAYPGFRPAVDVLGEYNGKFMSGQMVLRGGSCLSRAFHIRPSYRNFFYPRDRWQCTGIRLAHDV